MSTQKQVCSRRQGETVARIGREWSVIMSCDVTGCSGQTYMGWRPLTEPIGRQVCEYHWRRHKDAQDSFDLFEAFGFRMPERALKSKLRKDTVLRASGKELSLKRYCRDCGQPRESGHKYCHDCGKKRKAESNRHRQKRHYERRKPNAFAPPLPKGHILLLRPAKRL